MKIKYLFTIVLTVITMSSILNAQNSIWDFKVKTIDDKDLSLKELKGKKILIVNTASKCGLTPQYEDLENLYLKYKDNNFIIIGFPANNFNEQEPGTNEDIKNFCTSKYNVTFPMMSKISVNGDDMAPLYKWLTQKSLNSKFDSEVKWNFQKYMISETGELIGVVDPKEKPFCDKIVNWIEGKQVY